MRAISNRDCLCWIVQTRLGKAQDGVSLSYCGTGIMIPHIRSGQIAL